MLSETLGVSSQAVSNYMREGYSVGEGVLYKILSLFPQLNSVWLLKGEGEMLKDNVTTRPKLESNLTPVEEGNYQMVEYVDLRASAGRLGGSSGATSRNA